eukprot:1188167-Prorocentrum_minimum.AAC.5
MGTAPTSATLATSATFSESPDSGVKVRLLFKTFEFFGLDLDANVSLDPCKADPKMRMKRDDETLVPLDKYVFNTEAHPLPILGRMPWNDV